MSVIGNAMAITWAGFGLRIEKTTETQDMLEVYISVPESSFHRNVDGDEMSGVTLAKRFKTTLTEMGVKRLKRWYCGHYHTEKKIDKMQFMFQNIDTLQTG